MNDPAGIKLRYRTFADMECRGYSEAYYRLALAVAEDDDVVAFLSRMRVTQPNLFFASVQLLAGRDHMPISGPELRQFLRRRGGEVGDVMRFRRTQTNEVGRCAVLLSYVSPDHRRAFAAVLAEASSRRDVVWVSNEGAGIVGELAVLVPPPSELRFLLGRTRFTSGERHDELLGIAHPHGAALKWLEPRTVAEPFG